MNITKAKSIIGIRGSVAGRANLEAAMSAIKREIIAARRNRDDDRAAELSEAREVFRHRLIASGQCEVCHVTIGANATHCRRHQRTRRAMLPGPPKAKPLPKEYHDIAKTLTPPNSNARVDVAPAGGPLARLGLYTAPVQKVMKRWRGQVRDDMLERYFDDVATAVVNRETTMHMEWVSPDHWPIVFELGQAIAAVFNERKKPEAWLLRMTSTARNGKFPSWDAIAENIKAQGGPSFLPNHLTRTASKMKLITPEDIAKEYRSFKVVVTN